MLITLEKDLDSRTYNTSRKDYKDVNIKVYKRQQNYSHNGCVFQDPCKIFDVIDTA